MPARHSKKILRGSVVLLAFAGLFACQNAPSEADLMPQKSDESPVPAPAPTTATTPSSAPVASAPSQVRYDVPYRTDTELRAEAARVCREAKSASAPLLLDVGADWCGDCRKLYELERQQPLRSALNGWKTLTINLGEDRHEWLRAAFGIKAIARWLVVHPSDCAAPLESWTVVSSRVVEPKTGRDFRGPSELAEWLDAAKKKAR